MALSDQAGAALVSSVDILLSVKSRRRLVDVEKREGQRRRARRASLLRLPLSSYGNSAPVTKPSTLPDPQLIKNPAVQGSDLDFLNATLSTPPPAAPASPPTIPSLPTLPSTDPLAATFASLTLAAKPPEGTLDDAAIEELLRQMDEAEGAADGLEDRLDSLIGTLDGLLGALESVKDDAGEVVEEEEPEEVLDSGIREEDQS